MGPTQPPVQWVLWFLPGAGVKRPGRDADHSRLELKLRMTEIYTSSTPSVSLQDVHEDCLTFDFICCMTLLRPVFSYGLSWRADWSFYAFNSFQVTDQQWDFGESRIGYVCLVTIMWTERKRECLLGRDACVRYHTRALFTADLPPPHPILCTAFESTWEFRMLFEYMSLLKIAAFLVVKRRGFCRNVWREQAVMAFRLKNLT